MYIILLIIIVIIAIEIYCLIKNRTSIKNDKNLPSSIKVNSKFYNTPNFNKYLVVGDKKIKHNPGKIKINNNYNVIISTEDYKTLMEKDLIYNIMTPFEIEIINVNVSDKNIFYYYIHND